MSEYGIPEFLESFQRRRAFCRALLELSHRQAALIGQDDYSDLFQVLDSKQALLDDLGRLSHDEQPLYDAWSRQRGVLPAEERARCEAVLAETESLLADLVAMEQSSSSLLKLRRDATRSELEFLSAGATARQAYQSRPPAAASRFDLNT